MGRLSNPLEAIQAYRGQLWTVKGMIPSGGLVRLIGAPQAWKTFLLMKLAVCVANGKPFFGMNTTKSLVHYISAEDGVDAHIRRIAAEMDTVGATGSPLLRVHNTTPRIDTSLGLQELRARINWIKFHNDVVENVFDKYFFDGSANQELLFEACNDNSPYYSVDMLDDEKTRSPALRFIDSLNLLTANEMMKSEMYGLMCDEVYDAESDEEVDRLWPPPPNSTKVFNPPTVLIIDTYSATAADDEKSTVATYHRHLRQLQQEYCQNNSGPLTVIIADHFTKSGDSFMGSLAKAGDVDAMLFMKRREDIARLTCEKMRSAPHFPPITITKELFDTEIPSPDEEGKTLTTLVLRDGQEKQRRLDTAGSEIAAVILELLDESGGELEREELRDAFIGQQIEADPEKKADSLRRQFNRAISKMLKAEQVEESDGMIFRIPDE